MSENTIEVEAESIEEAREKAKLLIPEGYVWSSERIASYGSTWTKQYIADTIEDAHAKAENEIPKNAIIIEQKIIASPKTETISFEAINESSANWRIHDRFGDSIIIKSLNLSKKGRAGVFGIASKPNQYEATVLFPATIEISYKTNVRLIVEAKDVAARVQDFVEELRFVSSSSVASLEVEIVSLRSTIDQLQRQYPVSGIVIGFRISEMEILQAEIAKLEAEMVDYERQQAAEKAAHKIGWEFTGFVTKSRLTGLRELYSCKKRLAQLEKKHADAQEKEKDVRSQAALKLGELGNPIAVRPLITALTDEYPIVRSNAIKALENLQWEPKNISEQLLYIIAQGKLEDAVKLDDSVAAILMEFIAESSYMGIRPEIIRILAKIDDKRIVKPLMAIITDGKNSFTVLEAAIKLIGAPNFSKNLDGNDITVVTQSLISIIKEGKNLPAVRAAAIKAAGNIGFSKNQEGNDVIAQELKTSNQEIAAIALGRLGDKRAAGILAANLELKEKFEEGYKTVTDLVNATESLLTLSAKALDLKDLEKLAQLDDLKEVETKYEWKMNSGADDPYANTHREEETTTIFTKDLSQIRELARQELDRRKKSPLG